MTEYIAAGNTIVVADTEDFIAEHILKCGQVFRYCETQAGYAVHAGKETCAIWQDGRGKAILECSDAEYFVKYFDLNRDYSAIRAAVADDGIMSKAVEFGKGLRILRQEPIEMIFSFIISANNHIPRIRCIIERLCDGLGEDCGGYRSFPTLDALAAADIKFYDGLGAGYRAEYLYSTARALKEEIVPLELSVDTRQAGLQLMRLKGVGRKVADCILLFGYGRTDVYPVDTWIKKVALEYYGIESKAREYFLARYGNMSGYAQQYMYYYKRELNK